MKLNSVFLLAILILFSCKKDDDKFPPTVDRFSINGEEIEVFVEVGSSIQVIMEFSDDVELNQYRFKIKENFAKANGFEPLDIVVVNDLAGRSHATTLNILIPDSAVAGPYSAEVNALDVKGNESLTASIILTVLSSSEQPSINITSPDLSQAFTITKGDTLDLEGTVSDNTDLELVCIQLEGDTIVYNEAFDLSDTLRTTWNFDELAAQNKWIIIPTNTSNGDHELVIRAEDNDAHITVHKATITVVD